MTGTSAFTIRATDAERLLRGAFVFDTRRRRSVPTLPEVFLMLLALGLAAIGYVQLRRRARAG